MAMLERLFKGLVRVITNTFFRQIHVVGDENVPAEGAVIFAGNHPNALMDGWLLTATCGRWPLHFMGNAKLWKYRLLRPVLDACGAVPVYPREEYGDEADNSPAFEKLYKVLEAGNCMGVFPEGISHAEAHIVRLKTGTARVALAVADRGKTAVTIVPVGLIYVHRHRFGSQVLTEFGHPIVVGDDWSARFRDDEQRAVRELTDELTEALKAVTINAPDWRTIRFAQITRRLYKPSAAPLTPKQYVELNRRFIRGWEDLQGDPELAAFRYAAEDYQARLDMLGLRDYQLRSKISLAKATRKIVARALWVLLLLPLALPGAIIHLPVGWLILVLGERLAYDMDDIATIKVLAAMLLLPLVYLLAAIVAGSLFGAGWGIVTFVVLGLTFFAMTSVLALETSLLISMLSVFRLARLRSDVAELRETRRQLVAQIRALVDKHVAAGTDRIFTGDDFRRSVEP
jgi:glycerol-3-phosphate O-acyltransferase/dihydroxyacetone phosphate acyltransferase